MSNIDLMFSKGEEAKMMMNWCSYIWGWTYYIYVNNNVCNNVHRLLVHMKACAHSRYTTDYNKLMSHYNHDNGSCLYNDIILFNVV